MRTSLFTKLQENFDRDYGDKYSGETDIRKVLDLSRLKDNVDGLITEMTKQSSVYAYWANLRREAEEKLETVTTKFEVFKSGKFRSIIEELKSDGVKTPTGKMIEATFHRTYKDNSLYKKYSESIKRWKKRKDVLAIIEKSVGYRDNQLRSLSYLLSNMMSSGLVPRKALKRQTIKE